MFPYKSNYIYFALESEFQQKCVIEKPIQLQFLLIEQTFKKIYKTFKLLRECT